MPSETCFYSRKHEYLYGNCNKMLKKLSFGLSLRRYTLNGVIMKDLQGAEEMA